MRDARMVTELTGNIRKNVPEGSSYGLSRRQSWAITTKENGKYGSLGAVVSRHR